LESDPNYSAIVYDFGGVLAEIHFDRVIDHWAREAGTDSATLRSRFSFSPAYEAHERGEIDVGQYFQALRGELGIDIPDQAFAEGWNAVFGDEIAPTIELVRQLAPAIPQYLFSNTNAAHHRHWATRYPTALAPLRRVFVSYQMRLRKPERAAFEMIASEIGVPLERILFFDDTAANVDAACALGIRGVLVRSTEDVARAVKPWLGGAAARA
jgi:putative hydrolase of the HAD superfamily